MKLINYYNNIQAFETEFGTFDLQLFYNGLDEAVVLSYGDISEKKKFLVRIQTECVHHQLYRTNYCDCNEQIANSLKLIKQNHGALILLKSTKGQGLIAQFDTNTEDNRNYVIAIQILKEFYKVDAIQLISINRRKIDLIEKQVKIDKIIWYKKNYIQFNPLLDNIIRRITNNELISPFDSLSKAKKVLCIGDINIDFNTINNTYEVRGSGFNSWMAFNTYEYYPILFGKIGDDTNGIKVESEIKETIAENPNMYAMIGVHKTKPTCEVKIFPSDDNSFFHYNYDVNNANDYDRHNLEKTLQLIDFNKNDFIHIATYILFQYHYDINECKQFFKILSKAKAKIIIDIARYTVKKKPSGFNLNEMGKVLNASGEIFLLISDINSIKMLLSETDNTSNLNNKQIQKVFDVINTEYFICRRGDDVIKIQDIYKRSKEGYILLDASPHPWDDYHNSKDKRGYGDKITLDALDIISNNKTRSC